MTVAPRIADEVPADAVAPPCANRSAEALPRVSVIIVNWNRLDDVLMNLRYLRKLNYPNVEIIVVDNGSTDGSAARLGRVSDVQLIALERNEGPSVARNVGIAAATGKYVLLLDSDAVLAKRGLRALVDRMEADDTIGIAGCRIFNWHTRAIDQWLYAEPYRTHGDRSFDSYSFSAAGALLRTDVLRAIGGFWERLFIYNEEVDLSIRVIRAGFRVVYAPDARVFHRPSANGRTTGSAYFRRQIRNWIWIFFRHYGGWRCWWKVTQYSALYLIKGCANRELRACISGIIEGLRGHAIASEFAEKLTPAHAKLIRTLNSGRRLRLWNIAPGATRSEKRRQAAPLTEAPLPPMLVDEDEMPVSA